MLSNIINTSTFLNICQYHLLSKVKSFQRLKLQLEMHHFLLNYVVKGYFILLFDPVEW